MSPIGPVRQAAAGDAVSSGGALTLLAGSPIVLPVTVRSGPDAGLRPSLTRFFGREAELSQLRSLLASDRLVTVTGAGGVGKTRLALELVRGGLDTSPDGVWLVELALVESPDLVGPAISQTVGGLEDRDLDHLERAAGVLSSGRQLLVLDNCEHLLEGVAAAARRLLTQCPELRLLATSREPLGVEGEQVWRTPPLDLPPAGAHEVADAATTSAVRLFCDRARHAMPTFDLTADNVGDVVTVCRDLDGLPLALELAAAWMAVLSPKQVSSRLADSLALLVRGGVDRLARHRTMRATLDWSHQLLTPVQRAAFARLSVFVGGFTIEAAEALFTGLALDTTPLELVASLVARSLVVADVAHEEARFRLLEPVRQYAADKLRSEPADEDDARSRHLDFLAHLSETAEPAIFGGPDLPWLHRIDEELPNIRSALSWGFGNGRDDAARLAASLVWYCYARELHEGIEWSLQVIRGGGERQGRAYLMAGMLSMNHGDYDAAEAYLGESRQLATRDGERRELVHVLNYQAGVAVHRGDLEAARPFAEEALRLAREEGDERLQMRPLNRLGMVAFDEGNHAAARDHFLHALAISERHGATWPGLVHRCNLADVAVDMQDHGAARPALQGAFPIIAQIGATPAVTAGAIHDTGILAIQLGEPARGLRLLAAATAAMKRAHYRDIAGDAERSQQWIRMAREQVSGDADAAWREGMQLSLDQAVAEAQDFLSDAPVPGPTVPPPTGLAKGPTEPVLSGSFVREGEFWSLSYAGRVVRLRDSKGLRDIARLLVSPGREVAAVDLAANGRSERRSPWQRSAIQPGFAVEAGAGPLLDLEARQEYRQRLADLDEELADAEAANDPERETRARREREFLLGELSAAVGLGGRERISLDPAERARKAVTGRIREAIGRIEGAHPELGHHLRRSVRTGTFCVYDPPAPTTWVL